MPDANPSSGDDGRCSAACPANDDMGGALIRRRRGANANQIRPTYSPGSFIRVWMDSVYS